MAGRRSRHLPAGKQGCGAHGPDAVRITRGAPGPWTVRAARGVRPAEQAADVGGGAERGWSCGWRRPLALDSWIVSRRDAERERTRFEGEAGVTSRVITGQEIKMLPGLGEADVMRAIDVLPGVVSTSDFSSAFNVRGGSADQNLVLLDGFPIFNPFHLGGRFASSTSARGARRLLRRLRFAYAGCSALLNGETRPGGGRRFWRRSVCRCWRRG